MKESGPLAVEAGPDSGPGAGHRQSQQQQQQQQQPARGGGSGSATPTNNNSKGPIDSSAVVVNGNGAPAGVNNSNNFEYEDSEWDIGIGNLIIDLDADIEKNNGQQQQAANSASSSNHVTSNPDKSSSGMPSGGSPSNPASGSPSGGATVANPANCSGAAGVAKGKMAATAALQAVTHSAEPAGLKMKIKRTKPGPGTRSTEAKHEIVKTDGSSSPAPASNSSSTVSNSVNSANGPRHSNTQSANSSSSSSGGSGANSSKGRNMAAAHKRDKSREKHVASPPVVNKIPSPGAVSSTSCSVSTSSVAMTTSSGVTVTPVVSGASSVATSSASVRLPNSGALTVTPVATLPSSGAGGRTPPSGTECRPLSVLPQAITTNGNGSSNSAANYSNSAAPVTVTPVSGTQISPVMITGLANANGNSASTSPSNHNSTCPRPEEPPSPPSKKWRGHLPAENKVPMDTGSPVPNSVCPSAGRGVMVMAVPSPGGTTGSSGMANGTHSSSSPNSVSTATSQSASRSDACVGTCSASTMTEPECLGPCEPGTAVTLEGIVWHETEGGVLVVNVTWRGKTYVGTLLDCTRHDWAPPRFCDSPTSDVESRAPKGRAKRGRGATSTPVPTGAGANSLGADPSLSPMHSKLRNGAKGRRGVLPAPPSPAKETASNKRKGSRAAEEASFNNTSNNTNSNAAQPSSNKRSRSSSRGAGCSSPTSQLEAPAGQTLASSPLLIECPEPNCSKKYRHINGLKYHQSHAHSSSGGNGSGNNSGDNNFDEDSNPEMPAKKEAEESEVAPFTGKVPMPPGQNASAVGAPSASTAAVSTADADLVSPQKAAACSTSIPRTPTPSPSTAASKMPNSESVISAVPSAASTSTGGSINGQANVPVMAPSTSASAASGSEHLFAPIQPQPPASGPWVTSLTTPGPRVPPAQPQASESADSPASGDSGDHRKLGKHKKKSKDKDKDRDRDKERRKSEANASGLNGSQAYPSPAANPPAGTLPTASSPLVTAPGEVAAPLANGSMTNPPAVEQSREDVQSPAYSDISDANDQPSILNDADLSDGLSKKDKLATVDGLPGNPGAPPGAGHLGPFGMYPFYGQPPYMVPPGAAPTNLIMSNDAKSKEMEQRREEAHPPKSAPSMPPSGQHMHPYQPYGFMPPYPPYPMDPLMVDPTLRPSNKTPPEGAVLSPRGQILASRPPIDGMSPGRSSSKPSPMVQDENKPLPSDATKNAAKDLSKSPLDLGMPKSSPAPTQAMTAPQTTNPALHPAHQANKTVVDLTVSKEPKDPMEKVKGPAPGSEPKGVPGQYDPAVLAYHRQQEELRRYYNVYPPEGDVQGMPMYPPVPMNSPGGAPSWPGLVSGPKGSPLPERSKPPQPPTPQQNPQQMAPTSTPNSQPPQHQQTGKTMMANASASSPKLRPPSVESRSKEHEQHRHDQRREKERERERESSLERNKAASEGVKPTMETHGPPPPPGPPPGSMPGAQLAYPYLYPYGLPFDPSHPAYRSMASMLGGPPFGPPGPGPSHPFLGPGHPHLGPQQPQMPPGMRYPFPGGPPSEAHVLEMLHGQYWQGGLPPQGGQGPPPQGPPPPNQSQQPQQQNASQSQQSAAHKIHELTERALKSPPSSPAIGPGGLPSSSQSGATSSTPSGPKHSDRPPSGGMVPNMSHRPPGHGVPMPGPSPGHGGPPGHQLPGFLTPLSSQYPPSSVYGGKPLLRP